MRWKLLLVTSLLTAVAGSGASLIVIYGLLDSSPARILSFDLPTAATFLLPAGFITFAAIFVYRHTSRRRALQAIMTVLFAAVLTSAFLVAASALMAMRARRSSIDSEVTNPNASDATRPGTKEREEAHASTRIRVAEPEFSLRRK